MLDYQRLDFSSHGKPRRGAKWEFGLGTFGRERGKVSASILFIALIPSLWECRRVVRDNSRTTHSENELSKIILDAAFRIHTKTGPGLLETIYEVILANELRKQGLCVERHVPIPIRYDELVFEEGFRADLLVEDKVLVELKSVEQLNRVHSKQVLTQLRLSDKRLGLLINFGETQLKNGIQRIVNGLPE